MPAQVDRKKELMDLLKLEIAVLERGGYQPSVRDPRRLPRLFRDSVSCPNLGLEKKAEPCSHCWLMEFVPPEFRDTEDPCQHIPLNDHGDTIATLEAEGERERAEAELLNWLKATLARMEAEQQS